MGNGLRLKRIVLVVAFLPFLRWLYLASQGGLGIDPALWLMESSGQIAFAMLCLTLSVTPCRQLLSLPILIWCRRPLGVMTFFYAFCHFGIWAGAERHFSFRLMWQGIGERPFILLGVLALILLAVLAFTSNQTMVRKLGRRWQKLHRLVYLIAVLVSVHFILMQRVDESATHAYIGAGMVALLLLWRVVFHLKNQRVIADKMVAIHGSGERRVVSEDNTKNNEVSAKMISIQVSRKK